MNHQSERLRNINLNQLKAQINQYHMSNHTNFKSPNQLVNQFSESINEANSKLPKDLNNIKNSNNTNTKAQTHFSLSPNLSNKNQNQNLINFLVKSFKSSTSSLSNADVNTYRQSPSLFTSLSAPRASIDCYQLSESPSLNELSSGQQYFTTNGSIGKASSLALTPSPTAENNLYEKFNNLNADKIIEECAICKGVAIAAVNSTRRVSYSNVTLKVSSIDNVISENICADKSMLQFTDETNLNTVLNRHNLNVPSEIMSQNHSRIIVETKPDYCLKCFCFCCYDQLTGSRIFKYINEKRDKLKILVDGKLQRAILCAILINTLSMGIEHHDQVSSYNLVKDNKGRLRINIY